MKPLVLSSNSPATRPENAPRTDYELLAENLGAELLGPASGRALWRPLERTLGLDLWQARTAMKLQPPIAVSLSEKVGIPLALMGFRGRHILVAHHLSSRPKQILERRTKWLERFDGIVVLCREQERYLTGISGLSKERIHRIWDSIDTKFFCPQAVERDPELVLAVGREKRDYATLSLALKRLPHLRGLIVLGSPWARRRAEGEDISGLQISRPLSFGALRDAYARAAVVVVPLQKGIRYAAGVNAVLEAGAMGCSLVVTRTPGLADYLDVATRTVEPDDPEALASAIEEATANRPDPVALRALVERRHRIEDYAAALAGIARGER